MGALALGLAAETSAAVCAEVSMAAPSSGRSKIVVEIIFINFDIKSPD